MSFSNCAKKGSPTGGAKDTIAPQIVSSSPQNFATNFTETQIKIGFDEYIKLKNIKENLIISPPLTYDPLLSPQTSSRTLGIKIMDTLAPETTYVFNFGKSIVDNNEENPYDYFKYVFSTGSFIDSLTLSGAVYPADRPSLEDSATLLLYEATEPKQDSMVFKQRPRYVATTFDKTSEFNFSNLKPGAYYLVALQEDLNNYSFEPQTDLIGFLPDPITLPTDSSFVLRLFQETPDFKWTRASHSGKNRIVFGFQGAHEKYKITPLFEPPADFDFAWTKKPGVDSLNYWFKPAFDL
ncbi:MAG: Ig-like domain-containing protein, partial [Bacteroidetes bacterium]|nr:Ig-like domain-containing protein [Bacteroidota bacterium]